MFTFSVKQNKKKQENERQFKTLHLFDGIHSEKKIKNIHLYIIHEELLSKQKTQKAYV